MWPKSKPIPIAKAVADMPPYIFHVLKGWTKEVEAQGHKISMLSIGSPDQRPPQFVLKAMSDAVNTPGDDGYAPFDGHQYLKEAAAKWMKERFGVTCDPKKHIIVLIGSKEGLSNTPRAIADPGDSVLIPDPGYTAYQTSIRLAYVEPVFYTLRASNQFLPDPADISRLTTARTKGVFLNFPCNPTGKCINKNQLAELVEVSLKNGLAVVHDNPYSELYRETPPPSVFQVCDIESDPVMEFFSFSKMMNMGGWRVGFVVGHESLIKALLTVKTHMDTGVYGAIQKAAAEALNNKDGREKHIDFMRKLYDTRYRAAEEALAQHGFDFIKPEGTFYIWVKNPKGLSDMDWTKKALQKGHVLVTPGSAFGPSGKDYFRITMTHDAGPLKSYIERLAKARDS
jgi:aspartate/methionine/tyrosine aminotransferase